MKLVRRQTRRYREMQKLKGSAVAKTAVMGATVAVGQLVSLGSELGSSKTVHAASAQQTFINAIAPHAQELASQNDLYASVMIAQAILESSWGTSSLASVPNYNLFGIKGSYNGMSVNMPTLEDNGSGKYYRINDNFRKYPSYYESLNDYVHVLKTTRIGGNLYYRGAWRSQTSSYLDATKWLTGRYATDTAYASKLNNIIQRYQLIRFDGASGGSPIVDSDVTSSTETLSHLSVNGQYIVKAGDTLWSIANKSGMTVAELKQLNHLSSDSISVGQVLKLSTPLSDSNTNAKPLTTVPNTGTKPIVTPQTQSTQTQSTTETTSGEYVVQAGDTLWRISKNNGMTVEALKQLNGLTSDTIYVGQRLKVSGSGVTTTPTTPTVETVKPIQTVTPTVTPQVKSTATYTVQAGDTLWRIANRHGLSVAALKELNGLSGDTIYVGQVLALPGGTTTPVAPKSTPNAPVVTPIVSAPTTSTSEVSGATHTVQAGDTLWRIANRHGLSVAALKELNGLSGDIIYVGQVLALLGGTTTPVAPKSTPNAPVVTPIVSAPTTSTPEVSGATHTVQAGDTLWRISNRYGLTVDQLKAMNGLTSNTIYVGQVLSVKGGQVSRPNAPTVTSTVSNETTHIVQAGDTLWRISNRHGLSVEQLKQLNQLSSNTIYVGQQLKLK